MTLSEHLQDVRLGLREQRYPNESAISQGIVLRLLDALGWPTYDTRVVWPEYPTEGQRVDFALCHPAGKPLVFIEVKQTGKGMGADEQLFKYLLKGGIPLAVMTDGREWHFYLPGGAGSYEERRFYLLDLLERTVEESEARLRRYLAYEDAKVQRTIQSAWADYRDLSTAREIERHLPMAWSRLLSDADDALATVLAEKVESLSGYKPTPERIARFLRAQNGEPSVAPTLKPKPDQNNVAVRPAPPSPLPGTAEKGFILEGKFYPAKSGAHAYVQVMQLLCERDPEFAARFAEGRHGKKRRFVARTAQELFPDKPDLQQTNVRPLPGGWLLGLNVSIDNIKERLGLACQVAGLTYGRDLVLRV